MTSAYASLEARFRRLTLLGDAQGVLQWDMAAIMPDGGAGVRGDQLAALKVVSHEILTDRAVGDLLDGAESENRALDPWQRANLVEMRRSWRHATAVPAELVAARSKAVSDCEMAWRTARAANDFKGLLPLLRRVLALTRETAQAKAQALGVAPYDALLDRYEPGGSSREIGGPRGYERGGYDRSERDYFAVICSRCGNAAQVPFKPRMDKPVYCSDCFRAVQSA
mgnify:CR=1 FL=1